MEFKSAIFDMDGVITDTARIHFKAWKKVFDAYLGKDARRRAITFKPFTLDDYVQYVDGLSRLDGVKYFLHSRKIIPSQDKLNVTEEAVIQEIAELKNRIFLELVQQEGVNVFPGTIQLIKKFKNKNMKVAVISSSKNCVDILTRARVINLFDTIVDGKALRDLGLKGKPDPAIFLEAAKRINARPDQTIVIEDALSGIIAGKAGNFSLVIGIDRQNKHAAQFKESGANLVVHDLGELDLEKIDLLLTALKKKLVNKRIVLFSDYDGTLTPIVSRPELAVLANDVKDILYQLKQYCTVAIISGRQLSDLENRVGVNGLYYAGNHGFEIIGPEHFATKFELGLEFIEDIQHAYNALSSALHLVAGCLVENKKFSLSVHFRLVSAENIPTIEHIVNDIAAHYPMLSLQYGKKVIELRPKIDWHKGRALSYIQQQLQCNNDQCLTIYLGDDAADEDAFKEIGDKGISVLVAKQARATQAQYRLSNPQEVCFFLKEILSIVMQTAPEVVDPSWSLTYTEYEPERERLREALCTLGNGYFATRGAADEMCADDVHYPGTYFAGNYNQLKSVISNQEVINEDLVNMPNWLPITFKFHDSKEEWFTLTQGEILQYRQQLNMHKGVLSRTLCIKDKAGRITLLKFRRFVSMSNPHLAAQEFSLTAINWSGKIWIRSGLDGSVINSGVTRYQKLNSKHLEALNVSAYKDGSISLLMRTNQSHIEVGYSALHCLQYGDISLAVPQWIEKNPESIYCHFECDIKKNTVIKLEKLVTVATNKDMARSDCLTDTQNVLTLVKKEGFDALLRAHVSAWKKLWQRCDIKIDSDGDDQRILRLHIFHLLQTISKHSLDLDVGVPARGLHGESYRGHIFWDELFILPFYIYYFPENARSLLLYRFRRLNMARLLAKCSGYEGAMYPWQSANNGDEVTQRIHLNPLTGTWAPDFSHYQRHINAAIVYNIWQYYLMTHDVYFLAEYGAEMILEIARFWSSITCYNTNSQRYEIKHVVGPDEYHESYPGSKEPGVHNNAYTNVMAVWSLERALEVLELLTSSCKQALIEKLQLHATEIARWRELTTKMKITFHDNDIISQFDGYENLAEFDWNSYQKKYGNIERLDRILKAENDSPDNYKISKQADVLMLFYLLSFDELKSIFTKLGYPFNKTILVNNIFYYLKRTSHGSTLSKVVFASLTRYIEQDIVLKFYQDVLNSDITDIQGGTTAEGIHLGAMASCLNIILKCFAGLTLNNNTLMFDPQLPARIQKLQFNLQFRQNWLSVVVDKKMG